MTGRGAENQRMGTRTVAAKFVARLMLGLGFVAAAFSYATWASTRTIFDPQATRSAAHALLDAPAVRRSLSDSLAKQLARQLGAEGQPAEAEVSHDALARPAATALADPRFVDAFANAIALLHAQMLSNDAGKVAIDTGPVTAAVRDAIAKADPALAARFADMKRIEVVIGRGEVPHLGTVRDLAHALWVSEALSALVLLAGALLLQPTRALIGRAGRRTAYLSTAPLVAFVVLPLVLGRVHGDTPETIAPVLRAYGHRVIPSAIALIVIGITVCITALVWRPRGGGDETEPGPAAGNRPVRGELPDLRVAAVERPRVTEQLYL